MSVIVGYLYAANVVKYRQPESSRFVLHVISLLNYRMITCPIEVEFCILIFVMTY